MRSRFLPCCITVCVIAVSIIGCSRGPSEEELKMAELEGQLATLQQQYADLQQAREALVGAESTFVEIEALKESDRSDEQKAEFEALPLTIEELGATKDLAFEAAQGTLADFLNLALNEFPEHPATAQGLNLYSDEAIMIADETVLQAGD